jgi:hypothetical protein
VSLCTPRPLEVVMPSLVLDTSSSKTISNIWGAGSSSSTAFNFNKFLGLANGGFGVYDSTSGLPAPYSISGGYNVGTTGLGFGVRGSASVRAGLNLSASGSLGSAALDLNDNITLSWTKTPTSVILTSSYAYKPSRLSVTGPNVTATIDGRLDTNFSARLNYSYLGNNAVWYNPFRSIWQSTGNLLPSWLNRSTPLFSKTFNTAGNASFGLPAGVGSADFLGINLNTASNSQIGMGVRSSVNDPLFSVSLDLGAFAGKLVGLPSGLTFDTSGSFGPLSYYARLTLATMYAIYNGNISQDLTATVDSVTGVKASLRMENGAVVPYTIGSTLELPLSTYDSNNDGKLDITGAFTKSGTLNNNTKLINTFQAGAYFLNASAGVSGLGSVGLGPLASVGPYNLFSAPATLFNNTWSDTLGASTRSFSLA